MPETKNMKSRVSFLKFNSLKNALAGVIKMKKILFAFLICALPLIAQAQFNSGSTGADGALDLSTMTCPNNICEVQLPESGILNYTTVNIPSGKQLRFKKNSRNTPVILLAQSNVNIAGSIDISAPGIVTSPAVAGNIPGPGGFYGSTNANFPGFGPGGGQAGQAGVGGHGRWVGSLSLVPLVGGSGGGAGNTNGGGGGGGGAITIASSSQISVLPNYGITAWGGIGNPSFASGSCGGGGAIRLVANSLNITGNLYANSFFCAAQYSGVIRFEAQPGQINFTGATNPAPLISVINPTIVPSAIPQLTLTSIGGYAVPSYAGSRFDTVDLLLPNSIPDPVNVVVSANNIPVGTSVSVGFVSGSPNGTTAPCNLAGTFESSSCTATISNLNRTGVTYLLATAAFTPPAPLAKFNPKGKDQIAKIRLDAVLGKQPKYVFLRTDNSVIDNKKVPKEILQYFGM